MALTGFDDGYRGRGGVCAVRLMDCRDVEGVESNPADGSCSLAGVAAGAGSAEYRFAEDSAVYTEQLRSTTHGVEVEHKLVLRLDGLSRASRKSLAELAAAPRGVVAVVSLRCGEDLLVGWSPLFELSRPLRLDSASSLSGGSIKQLPGRSLTLVSVDTECAPFLNH